MFDALVNGRIDCGELTFEVAYYDIEELNRRAEAGETDVSKISYALLPEIQSRYTLLDSGSALGRGNGPVFVARQGTPPDSIRRVAVPGMHTTANALMSRLYPSITQKAGALLGNRTRRGTRGVRRRGVDPRRPFRLSETGPEPGRRLGRVVGIPHRIAASAGSHRRPTDTAGRASLRNRTVAPHEHRICFRTPGGIPHLY